MPQAAYAPSLRSDADVLAQWAHASSFLEWTDRDRQAIRDTAPLLGPLLPGLLDAAIDKMLAYADTAQYFTHPNGEIDREYAETHRRLFLRWLTIAASGEDDANFARYVAAVGRAHTPLAGDPNVVVPRRLLVTMMGWIQSAITDALFALTPNNLDLLRSAVLAWQKRLYIHLALFVMDYSR